MPIFLEYDVSYDVLDEAKRTAMAFASESDHLERHGFRTLTWSRGESCFLRYHPGRGVYIGHTQECLGTMNLAEDARAAADPESDSFYDHVGQTNVAMIANDVATSGCRIVSLGMYLAIGDESWFSNRWRFARLCEGQVRACVMARAPWGPGETPKLRGNVTPDGADIAGSGVGIIYRHDHVINPANMEHRDVMVALYGTGIHGNGFTAARDLAAKLPQGYRTPLPGSSRDFGSALIQPTPLYNIVVEDCQDEGIPIHYVVNVTGHGWLKLMRAPQPWVYVIERLPRLLPIFEFIRTQSGWPLEKMYRTFNMNAGYVLFVPQRYVGQVLAVARRLGFDGMPIGHIEKHGREKKMVGEIEFDGSALNIR